MEMTERLRLVRDSFGVSQRALSLELGLSESTWRLYEDGRSLPGLAVLESLGRRGIDLNWLVRGIGSMWLPGADSPASSITSHLMREQHRLEDMFGLARLALAGSRGRIREQLRILDCLVAALPGSLILAEIVTQSNLNETVVVIELMNLMKLGLVSEVVVDGETHYATTSEQLRRDAREIGDREQVVFDAISILTSEIGPASLEQPAQGTVVHARAWAPEGQGRSTIKELREHILARFERDPGAKAEEIVLVFGGALTRPT